MPWLMHVFAGSDHYIRLTVGQPRRRQIRLYERLGATVEVEEVEDGKVPPQARFRQMVKVSDGGSHE